VLGARFWLSVELPASQCRGPSEKGQFFNALHNRFAHPRRLTLHPSRRDRRALVTAARKWLQAAYNARKLKAASRLTAFRRTRSVLVAHAHHWLEMTWHGKKYKAASCVVSQRRDRACLEMVLSSWIGTTYWMRRYESASARLIAKTCSACLSIHFGEWRAAAKFEIGLRSAIDVRLARRRGHVLDAWAHVTFTDKKRSVASARISSSRERGWTAKLFRAWALRSGEFRTQSFLHKGRNLELQTIYT
jgi:hypothetical protein